MRVAILEDDKYWAERIIREVNNIPNYVTTCETWDDPEEFVASGMNYDVVFFDIEIAASEKTGLWACELFKKQYPDRSRFGVIITSHSELQGMGYRVSAFRYICKELFEENMQECLSAIVNKIESECRLLIKDKDMGDVEICSSNILYIEKQNRNTIISTTVGMYTSLMPISELASKLSDYGFAFASRGLLVNYMQVIGVNNDSVVVLENNKKKKMPISRRKKTNFLRDMAEYRYRFLDF